MGDIVFEPGLTRGKGDITSLTCLREEVLATCTLLRRHGYCCVELTGSRSHGRVLLLLLGAGNY